MPPALENCPDVQSYEREYVIAFSVLSDRRSPGWGGPNPISMTDILAYLQLYPTHDVDLFIYLVSLMDNVYIELKTK